VFIGEQLPTHWLLPSIAVDRKWFIFTGAEAAESDLWPSTDREPCVVETICPGVFAAGDVRSGTTKRVAFAVGDGALAVTCAHRVLEEICSADLPTIGRIGRCPCCGLRPSTGVKSLTSARSGRGPPV
jgi:hypothetical protein